MKKRPLLNPIERYVKKHDSSIEEVLNSANISRSAYYHWVNGKYSPSLAHVITLFYVFDGAIDVFTMLSDSDKEDLRDFFYKWPSIRKKLAKARLKEAITQHALKIDELLDPLDDGDLL